MSINIDNLLDSKHVTVSTKDTHKATATVGKDTIEDVEYIVFDHSSWHRSNETKTLKDKVEKVWDVITTPYYKAKHKISRAYWEVRYGFERMFKGYDSVDTFETFAKFVERYEKILKELRGCHYGYPFGLTEKEWDDVLDEMIYHLYYMNEWHVIEELEKDVPNDWSASAKVISEVMDKHKDEFFKLFSEYFYNLWD